MRGVVDMIVRSAALRGRRPPEETVRGVIAEFLSGRPRMDMLRAMYDGGHGILERRRASGLPNTRLVHDFPRYICAMASGYLIGSPVRYETDDARSAALANVLRCYDACAADSVDAELARQASLYGRGVELVFADAGRMPRTAALDPRSAFVVYDDTVECRPLFGVRLLQRLDDAGRVASYGTEIITDTEILTYDSPSRGSLGTLESVRRHWFGMLPMVEYWNGEDERGDFEGVISLIDAYDALESDRVNDKAQFVDALLLLTGCTLETDEKGRTPGQQLREDKVLSLPDSDAGAEWLCKQLNETDTEVLRGALAADIHKLSLVPDLSDERFAGISSGIALRYRLLGLEQLTKVKERWFREALRQRLRLFCAYLALNGAAVPDPCAVRMVFTRALPLDEEARRD